MSSGAYDDSTPLVQRPALRLHWDRPWWVLVGILLFVALAVAGVWWMFQLAAAPHEAPEAEKILAVQAGMPFQILIPAYLPEEFNRYGVEVKVNQQGPSGEPMTELTYRTAGGAALFVRQWVPVNPDMEILSGSRPIQTKWGKGWLLTQAKSLIAEWVDIGPLRVSLFTNNLNLVSREELVQIGDTLGPASGRQVFTFVVDRPAVKDVPLPPPVEAQINGEGVQELTLVVTPGGYSPIRFAVKKGIPVRITFKQLGPVGCGNDLTLPTDGENAISLHLESEADKDVAEFTPQQAGDFKFHCPHDMYRGIMTVRE